MSRTSGVLLCLAYIVGLLLVPLPGGSYGMLVLGAIAALTLPRYWRMGPKSGIWLLVGIVGFLASFYFHVRTPQPPGIDLSAWMGQPVTVQGKVLSEPRLTRSQRIQFKLNVIQIEDQPVQINAYTTAPLLQATGLHPGYQVEVRGRLYEPQLATIPGGFNFRHYLARQGMFIGLSAETLKFESNQASWGLWWVRQRIVRSLVQGLDVPQGIVIGSMVLGRRAVDLPFDIRDKFIQVGLAHVLAASGFHVSLLLGLVLTLTRELSKRIQFRAGVTILILYSALTGFTPSVLRASLMGFGVVLGKLLDRRVNILGSLLLTATLLLLVNPLWIQDLGFQLSFLATLGLVVTVPVLMELWDYVPPAIASGLAVPISAFLWTFPLQLYHFGVLPPYGTSVNLVTLLLVVVLTLGGMVSAYVALIWPFLGSLVSSVLYYPTVAFLAIIDGFTELPGNSVAVGKISVVQLLVLYGVFALFWLKDRIGIKAKKMLLGMAISLAIAVVVIPLWYSQQYLSQVTVFATRTPTVAIQDRGKVVLVNTPDFGVAQYTLIPFFQSQGVNQLDAGIMLTREERAIQGWLGILDTLPIRRFYQIGNPTTQVEPKIEEQVNTYQTLQVNQGLKWKTLSIKGLSLEPQVLEVQLEHQRWLMLKGRGFTENFCAVQSWCSSQGKPTVLIWSGKGLAVEVIEKIQPKVAIALSEDLDPAILSALRATNTQVFLTGRDGAIQWNSQRGFSTTSNSQSQNDFAF
ncbi:MAG: ComEC/Rec2 family competence protein [Roseofilum sp. SID2]|uniref:ComEC/Rec2 family competence protein n=1 Tax=unclassified Roseofilum TaxID=2620099 RepID=UPI001B1E70DD|nr:MULTISPECIES: ComEC/Rec2 family competence protein [unclassified Roseofilum]MBP0011731.1 ComEC/Rec2 family competence protein [Roseofilum sp. SID3]MBP0024016.1 ComEC/Rec2 family competence protein [Roseofilum sp. SID2]MBP0039123.1 ComEC/Rec2 family competence protein [Roseofilum sp. SID1]